MKKIQFYKYHGLGNDFLIIDLIEKSQAGYDFNKLAKSICDRNTGVGADGIMVLTKSARADCCLDLFNSDGSWAEKSGNGLRCVAAYFYSHYARRKNLTFEINDEISSVKIEKSDKVSFMMEVSLGRPVFETDKIPMKCDAKFHINQPIVIEGNKLPVTSLSVGNPHTVMFLDNFEFDWQELGQIIETCEYYPHRTNVEFVKIVNRKKVILNDWERGAGATGSSGTGAAAAAVAGVVNGLLDREVEVVFPGGSLFIRWNEDDDTIYLTGPADFSCEGTFYFIDK